MQQIRVYVPIPIYAFFGQNLALGRILPKNSAKTPKNYPFFNGACRQKYKKTDTHYRCLLSICDFSSNLVLNNIRINILNNFFRRFRLTKQGF